MKFTHKLVLWLIMGLALGTLVFGVLQFMGPGSPPPEAPGPGGGTNAAVSK